MSKNSIKPKSGITLIPVDPSTIVDPEIGDIVVDSTDSNKFKIWGGAIWSLPAGSDDVDVVFKNSDFVAEYSKVYVISSIGTINATLPLPVASKIVKIKKLGNNQVTLVRNGSEKIDDVAANKVLTSTKESVTLVSDGVDWFII